MTWDAIKRIAQAGVPVRRKSWAGDPVTSGARIVYVAGAGTTRAVAVYRLSGVDAVVTAATFSAADWLADDWEEIKG